MEQIKGLFIKEPWISLILSGKKTWEIRSSNTSIRGRIALIASGTGTVVGYADIVDSIEIEPIHFDENIDKHNIPQERYSSNNMPYKKTYAWILANPKRLKNSIPFEPKRGCVIWINLNNKEIIDNQ